MTDGLSHDGVIHFAVDSERTRIPLNATNMAGERVFFHACCNCGLIHEVAIGPDYVVFVRANEQDADLLRQPPLLHRLGRLARYVRFSRRFERIQLLNANGQGR